MAYYYKGTDLKNILANCKYTIPTNSAQQTALSAYGIQATLNQYTWSTVGFAEQRSLNNLGYLFNNGSIFNGVDAYYQEFQGTNPSFQVPTDVSYIKVIAISGGGNGGNGGKGVYQAFNSKYNDGGDGGSGGYGGYCFSKFNVANDLNGRNIQYSVGGPGVFTAVSTGSVLLINCNPGKNGNNGSDATASNKGVNGTIGQSGTVYTTKAADYKFTSGQTTYSPTAINGNVDISNFVSNYGSPGLGGQGGNSTNTQGSDGQPGNPGFLRIYYYYN